MAATPSVFEARLRNFLGPETYIYPDLSTFERPNWRVKDVVGALFALRSDIAHGREIKEQYWKTKTEIYGDKQEFRQILTDAALFLLCQFMQKVFLQNLVDTVRDTKKWRFQLEKASV